MCRLMYILHSSLFVACISLIVPPLICFTYVSFNLFEVLLDTCIRVSVGLVVNYTLRVMGFGVIMSVCSRREWF